MKNYKPFSKQFRECKENGNQIAITIPEKMYLSFKDAEHIQTHTCLVCLKYKTICGSIVCKKERMK